MGKHSLILLAADWRGVWRHVTRRKLLAIVLGPVLSWSAGCAPRAEFAGQVNGGLDEPNVLTVNVLRPSLAENVEDTASYFGILQPRRSSALGFARGGQVGRIKNDLGDTVKSGDEIASLEQPQLENQRTQIVQSLAPLRQELAGLSTPPSTAINQQRASQIQGQITSLESQQREIELELANGVIRAPYEGLIADRMVEIGDSVPEGRPAFQFVDNAPPTVDLEVAVHVARRVQLGQRVRVLWEGTTLQASVRAKSPVLNTSRRTQSLILDIEPINEAGQWTYGDVVEIQFKLTTQKSGYWLPYSALVREPNGLWSVFVVAGEGDLGRVKTRRVDVLQLDDESALIRGTVQDDDRVIVDGLNRIVPGQQVLGRDVTTEGWSPEQSETDE